jgi:hypothetical protein
MIAVGLRRKQCLVWDRAVVLRMSFTGAHRVERREDRPSGSEGGVAVAAVSLPVSNGQHAQAQGLAVGCLGRARTAHLPGRFGFPPFGFVLDFGFGASDLAVGTMAQT